MSYGITHGRQNSLVGLVEDALVDGTAHLAQCGGALFCSRTGLPSKKPGRAAASRSTRAKAALNTVNNDHTNLALCGVLVLKLISLTCQYAEVLGRSDPLAGLVRCILDDLHNVDSKRHQPDLGHLQAKARAKASRQKAMHFRQKATHLSCNVAVSHLFKPRD